MRDSPKLKNGILQNERLPHSAVGDYPEVILFIYFFLRISDLLLCFHRFMILQLDTELNINHSSSDPCRGMFEERESERERNKRFANKRSHQLNITLCH